MTETRTYDLHHYQLLEPDWLTKHQPRTIEHSQEHPDGSISVGLMSEIGDGVFVNWTQCDRCKKHFTQCSCPEGPQESPSLAKSRAARWAKSFDGRPDLPAGREVTEKVLSALRDRGYAIGEVPEPVVQHVEVPAKLNAESVRSLMDEVQQAQDAGLGDSNDEEIDLLRGALDVALGLLGLQLPEGRDPDEEDEEDEEERPTVVVDPGQPAETVETGGSAEPPAERNLDDITIDF